LLLISLILIGFSAPAEGPSSQDPNYLDVDAVPEGYIHRPIMEMFTGLGCSVCQNGADQAMDVLWHEAQEQPSQPFTIVSFHQNNGAGDDDLTIPESQERYDDYFIQGTPDAEFDGGFRHVLGGEDGEEANYQVYSDAITDSLTRYDDNNFNPLDNNFKFVNLQLFQEFSGDGYRVSVKIDYLGSSSELPGLGILPRNSPDLSGSLYVFMTEDNVTAWSSERNDGEYVENNAAFRGYAIKDEQFSLAKDETFEIMAEWQFPEDPVIPIKPGLITAVAAVYDLDDTTSGRSEGGNPASVPRAIQSATPKSTAFDLGSDIPSIEDITITNDKEVHFSAKFDDADGVSAAYLLYNTEAANATSWEYAEMEILGEEICDENDVCYAYADSTGTASIPVKSGETIYYSLLIYDGVKVEGKTELTTFDVGGSTAAGGAGGLSLTAALMIIGLIFLVFGFLYYLRDIRGKEQVEAIPVSETEPNSALPSSLRGRKPNKSMILGAIVLGMVLISVGAIASVMPSGSKEVTDFEMRDVDGNEFSLSDHRGKVVILEFMATWCSDCKKMTKEMKSVYSHYGNDVIMISLDIDDAETPKLLNDYANENGAKWIFAFPKDFNSVATTFNIHEIPKSLIIDEDGYITFEIIGSHPSGELIKKVEATKQGAADPIASYSMPIIILAFAAGVASFFSPCSFPMLPGYVGYYLGMENEEEKKTKKELVRKAIPMGIAAAVGVLFVYLFIGFLIMLIGAPILPFIPFFAPIVAIMVIILGIFMLTNMQYYFITNKINSIATSVISKIKIGNKNIGDKINEKEVGGVFAYGMGYGLAAAGCTLPVFLIIIATSISTGGFFSGMLMFFVYGLGAAIFMVAVTLLVASSKDSIVNKMKMSTHKIKVISGVFMVVAGFVLLLMFYVTFMI
jgi:cytochrome c-type biogenesis protein